MKSSKSAKCSSVSPGNPTMNVVRMASPGMPDAEAADQIFDVLPRRFPAHRAKHLAVNVLERHIHISCDFRVASDRGNQLVAPMRRMRVEKPNPKLSFNRSQAHRAIGQGSDPRRESTGWRGPAFSGHKSIPKIGRVLADQVDLLYPLGERDCALPPPRIQPCGSDAARASAG